MVGSTARIIIEEDQKKKRGRWWLYLRLILLGIAGVLCYRLVAMPIFISGFGMADTRPVPGDASRFDPIASLPEIKAYAGENVQLISIDAYYVRSDGTMELTADYSPSPNVEYKFVREVPRPADAPPVGAGGANTGPWYEPITIEASKPGQWFTVSRTGGGSRTTYSYMNQGMEREVDSPDDGLSDQIVADPACSFAGLWQQAIKHDAPRDAVATIEYDVSGYNFNISGLSIYLTFDTNCQLTSPLPVPTLASP